MKTLIKIAAFGMMLPSLPCAAQSGFITDTIVVQAASVENKVFIALAIIQVNNRTRLEFKVAKVQNVRNYRIEAGDDVTSLSCVGSVTPAINSMVPYVFSCPLAGSSARYKYYRVVQVSMGQEWTSSQVISRPTNDDGGAGYSGITKNPGPEVPVSARFPEFISRRSGR